MSEPKNTPETERTTQEKVDSLRRAIEELGFSVEETEEGLRVSHPE